MKAYPGDFHGLPPATEQICLLQLPYLTIRMQLLLFIYKCSALNCDINFSMSVNFLKET